MIVEKQKKTKTEMKLSRTLIKDYPWEGGGRGGGIGYSTSHHPKKVTEITIILGNYSTSLVSRPCFIKVTGGGGGGGGGGNRAW